MPSRWVELAGSTLMVHEGGTSQREACPPPQATFPHLGGPDNRFPSGAHAQPAHDPLYFQTQGPMRKARGRDMCWLHTCQQVSPRRHLAQSSETLHTQPLQKGGASQNSWEGLRVTANQIRKLTWE